MTLSQTRVDRSGRVGGVLGRTIIVTVYGATSRDQVVRPGEYCLDVLATGNERSRWWSSVKDECDERRLCRE